MVKIDHNRTARFGRHVPDDDPFPIRSGQDLLLGLRKAGRLGRDASGLRDRKDERALREEQHDETGEIAGRGNDDEPFQDGHWSAAGTPETAAAARI